jgi:hypothetical protein
MVILVNFIDSIYYSIFYVFLFWLLKPEYFVCKVDHRLASKIEICFFMLITLTSLNIISEIIWYRVDRGFTIFDWESGEHYVSLLGYLTVFYLTYWLVFVRGSLVSQTKL